MGPDRPEWLGPVLAGIDDLVRRFDGVGGRTALLHHDPSVPHDCRTR
ncbi:hypothetical protein P9869_27600 [Streptomyces ossamyceticus]|nr:hypothetical protein [Streptomyces ossamyceticus]